MQSSRNRLNAYLRSECSVLILGAAAIVRPLAVRSEIVKLEVLVMVGASVLIWLLLLDGGLGRIDGLLLTACAVGYTYLNYRLAKINKQ